MIIPLAIVLGFHAQGAKPSPLERRFHESEGFYESRWQKLTLTIPSVEEMDAKRIDSNFSKEFESIAIGFAKSPQALEAWTLALFSSPRDQNREKYLLDKIFLTKTVNSDQRAFFQRWRKYWAGYAHTFVSASQVLNLVDLFAPNPLTKAGKADLLLTKASWMDDTNDLKWDVYNRLVEQYPGTDAAKNARQMLLKKKNLQPGDEFFDFISKDSDGKKFRLSGLRGKVVVLEFWANWCPSCQRTIPVMQGVEKEFAGQNVEFVGINSDGAASVVKEIQAKWRMTTRTLVDGSPTGPISVRYAIMAWPSFFVIGKDGKVVFRSSGIDADGMTRAIKEASK